MNRNTPAESSGEFVEQLHEHQRIVRKVCSVYAAGMEERDELFQEIVAQLWTAWPGFRRESSFSTWAFRVALNTALFRGRSAAREGRGESPEVLDRTPAPSEPDPVEREEASALLYGCIRDLKELDRAIVLMHLEERPQYEIAEFTGLTSGNVSVRLHRIKNTLRKCLAARGYTEEGLS